MWTLPKKPSPLTLWAKLTLTTQRHWSISRGDTGTDATYQTRAEYLSGMREKLDIALAAALTDGRYAVNFRAFGWETS